MRNRILAIAAIAAPRRTDRGAGAERNDHGRRARRHRDHHRHPTASPPISVRHSVNMSFARRVPTFTIPDRVVVGGVLPEAGITYYDVPQTYGQTTYRYTVVNGQTVLVEPRTRRIVQVVD